MLDCQIGAWEFDQLEKEDLIRVQQLMPKYEKGVEGEDDDVDDCEDLSAAGHAGYT